MNAIELLKNDHNRLRELFQNANDAASIEERRALFEQIRDELDVHRHVEEAIFYPAFGDHEPLKEFLEEAYEEHAEIEDLMLEVDECADDDFEERFEELQDSVEHHIDEEEEILFPEARNIKSEAELTELADHIIATRHRREAA